MNPTLPQSPPPSRQDAPLKATKKISAAVPDTKNSNDAELPKEERPGLSFLWITDENLFRVKDGYVMIIPRVVNFDEKRFKLELRPRRLDPDELPSNYTERDLPRALHEQLKSLEKEGLNHGWSLEGVERHQPSETLNTSRRKRDPRLDRLAAVTVENPKPRPLKNSTPKKAKKATPKREQKTPLNGDGASLIPTRAIAKPTAKKFQANQSSVEIEQRMKELEAKLRKEGKIK